MQLRIVNIGSWESAAAQDHGIRSLPQLWLYVDGKLVTTDSEKVLSLID